MFWRKKKAREIEDLPDIEEVKKLEKRIETAERLASAQGTQQRYIIKKEVRVGRRRTLMALPSEEEPRYFTSFPSIDDIRREFYEDFGGGSYHVYATTPREFRVHTYELGGEERSPFVEEEMEVKAKGEATNPAAATATASSPPQSSEYEEIQQALLVSQQAGISFQEAWGFLREAKMRKREEEKESLEDSLEKSAKAALDQDPELKNEIVRAYLRSRFKEGDELNKLLQYEEVRRRLAGNSEGLLNPQILSYFLAFLPMLFAQPSQPPQPLAGPVGQPSMPQAMFSPNQMSLPAPHSTLQPWQQWELMLRQQRQQQQQQQQRQQQQQAQQPPQQLQQLQQQQQWQQWQQQQQQQGQQSTYIKALSNLVQMLAQREPEEVLSLLRAAKNNPYVRALLIFLRKINYDYNKLITYASMYGGEEIANALREHEDWLRRFLELLRRGVVRKQAARKTRSRAKQRKQATGEDLDFSVGEVQIDLGLEEEKEGGKEEKGGGEKGVEGGGGNGSGS